MQGIRNIIFDAGGVLVDVSGQATIDAFLALGVDVKDFIGSTRQKGLFLQLEKGLISECDFYDAIRALAPDKALRDEQIRDAWNAMLLRFPLQRLKAVDRLAQHYNIAILSNTNAIHWQHCEQQMLIPQGWPLREHVERVYLSHELHMAKPDVEIFQEVLRRSGFRAEETLLVDDSAANCKTARTLGMQTFTPTFGDEWLGELLPSVATIGFFDGVHRGHQYLLDQVKDLAKSRGMQSMVFTFDKHPRQVLNANFVPQLLTSLDEKVALLHETNVDETVVLPFTQQLSQLSARDFMRDVLRNQYGVRVLVMGYDHRFGHDGGAFENYVKWGEELGIEVLQAKELSTLPASSSRVRRMIAESDVASAAEMLGRPYTLTGVVEHGRQVGRTIGFPTANLSCSAEKLLPARGVYAVQAQTCDGVLHNGMLCIGNRPTLDDGERVSVEVHLFDFEGDLYDQTMTLQVLAYLRCEQRYESLDALRTQLLHDKVRAQAVLAQRVVSE